MHIPHRPKQRLYCLLEQLAEGSISVEQFTGAFETTYNLDLDKRELDEVEAPAFAELFDKVVWYSPIPEDLANVPNYLGDDAIRAAADSVRERLAARRPQPP